MSRFLGIDFSGNHLMWRPGCRRSNEWISDVRRSDERLVLERLMRVQELPGDEHPLERLANTLYFNADDGIHGEELWKSDGTEAGTVIVKDIYLRGSSSPKSLTAVGSTLYFSADDGTYGFELWKSNGTDAGTVMVKDINPGSYSSSPDLLIAGESTF